MRYITCMRTLIIAALCIALTPAVAPAGEELKITPVQGGGEYRPPKPKKGFRYPDCFCTDSKGQRVEIGRTSCLQIGSQSFLAKCGMSLNNPIWRRVEDKCPAPST